MQSARREQQIERHLHVVEGGIAGFIPAHERILSSAECEALATEIVKTGVWNGVELTPTESHTRAYALLHEDERMEIWLLSWLPHHSTGFHDHGESNVGFCVAQGTLIEQQLRFAKRPSAATLVVGDSRAAGSDYIHCLEWETGDAGALGARLLAAPRGRGPVSLGRERHAPPRHPVGSRRADEGLEQYLSAPRRRV